MHSPTALTPEPVGANTSMSSMHSLESMGDTDQSVISLTPSPLAVRAFEDAPPKTTHIAHPFHALDEANTNRTPNRPSHMMNQTPLRSTPLLTPPSSNERPQQSPTHMPQRMPSFQIPLTEKIQAQSALYSQAIQKQQQQKILVNSNQQKPTTGTAVSSQVHHIETLSNTLPPLSYLQLQKQHQQHQIQQHHNVSPLDREPVEDLPPAGSPEPQTTSLTAVELPTGSESIISCEQDPQVAPSQAARSTGPIPKPDPLENPLNTTNVYINGLPLRWTDDDLYRLTRGFGAVKSVKMFTRHLEDKPSAYGFVLFNCVEDAERFIMTLRQHTQFHPSFAKTMKVPGTTNSKHAIADPIIPAPRNEEFADISISGLPLSVDMQTLRALFSPQIIKASKFFHTAGTPRRLVGFIRLENQSAADEIIERLHGSSVLGWSEKLVVQTIPSIHDEGAVPVFEEGSLEQKVAAIQPQHPAPASSTLQAPSLGVYRHQQVQANDIVRLLGTMKMNESHHDVLGQSAIHESPIESHPDMADRRFLPPAQLYDSAHSIGHRQPVHANSTGEENDRVGLGINVTESVGRPLPVFHNSNQTSEPLQQTRFQSASAAPPATLHALQAAVLAQDLLFSSTLPSSLRRVTPGFGFEQASRQVTPWTSANEPPLQGLKGNNSYPSLPFNVLADTGIYYPAVNGHLTNPNHTPYSRRPPGVFPRFPAPPSMQGDTASVHDSESVKNVPLHLPGLTSSSQPSSPEPSPITPTFGNPPNHLVGTKPEGV